MSSPSNEELAAIYDDAFDLILSTEPGAEPGAPHAAAIRAIYIKGVESGKRPRQGDAIAGDPTRP